MMGEWISLYNNIMNNKVGGIKKIGNRKTNGERERERESSEVC